MNTSTLTIAVTSGKGGVGKSVLVAGLAESFARRGVSVAVLDAVPGQGAQSILFNTTPKHDVVAWMECKARLPEVLHDTEQGVTLVTAALHPPTSTSQEALAGALDRALAVLRHRFRVVLIDAPPGVEGWVPWALDRADLGIVVVAGEPTAVADAYRLARYVYERDSAYPLGMLVNFADHEEDAFGIAERFSDVLNTFVGQAPPLVGWMPYMPSMRTDVRNQRLPGTTDPRLRALFDGLATALLPAVAKHTPTPIFP